MKAWLDGAALHIRFNNPRSTTRSGGHVGSASAALAQAEADAAVRLVVFSGEGTKSFVSGATSRSCEDMRAAREAVMRYELVADGRAHGHPRLRQAHGRAIRGYCIGGGVNVSISCDIRLATADSVFAIPATRLGLGYRLSALKNLVGPARARPRPRTCSSPRGASDAAEALAIGLVNRVVPPEGSSAGGRVTC